MKEKIALRNNSAREKSYEKKSNPFLRAIKAEKSH
jgi:hypothetical protein